MVHVEGNTEQLENQQISCPEFADRLILENSLMNVSTRVSNDNEFSDTISE